MAFAGEESFAQRGRVRIVENNVVADNGEPLRGEHLLITKWNRGRVQDPAVWLALRDQYRLNTVRLLVYRPPVTSCYPPYDNPSNPQNCLTVQEIIPMLREAVTMAGQMGMYAIIDYHCGGGIEREDAFQWWSAVAPVFRNDPHVLYQAANEPGPWDAKEYAQEDITLQDQLYTLIRGYAPETHIILWDFPGTVQALRTTVDRAPSIGYDNASVGFHAYWEGPHAIAYANDLRAKYPVIMTEMERTPPKYGTGDYNPDVEVLEFHRYSWILLAAHPKAPDQPNYLDSLRITWNRDPLATSTPQNVWKAFSLTRRPPTLDPSALLGDLAQTTFEYVSATNSYVQPTQLRVGSGYWVMIRADEALPQPSGEDITGFSMECSQSGWVFLGALSQSIPVNRLTTTPPGNIASAVFRYDHGVGYLAVESLEPGQGYWLYIAEPCTLELRGDTAP
jgi:hypothetical protein